MPSTKLTTQEFQHLLLHLPGEPALLSAGADISLLQLLATIDRHILTNLMTEQHMAAGDVLFREREPGHTMYLIRSGRVIVLTGDVLMPTILDCPGPGEVVGEMALLDGSIRSATVIALEPTRMLRIDREAWQQLLTLFPDTGQQVMTLLSARLRKSDQMRSVDVQVGRYLTRQISTLHQENVELIELQRARQDMSDLIIHDLRSPLNLMFGTLQMLELVLPEDVLESNRELLDIAQSAHRRMQRLVDSLLDMAQMQNTELALRMTAVSLPALLQEITSHLAFSLTHHRLTFHHQLPADLPLVRGDEEKLSRVLANLLENAIKFTPDGGHIWARAEITETEILFSLTDTGPGIPLADRDRVFERFARARERHTLTRGYGLGLAYCKLAIEAHNGRIWVESGDNDIGCRFIFALPRYTWNT